jgi:hypothetical protein
MLSKSPPTIFVAIASYADPILPWTLDSCIANARRPENLRFGICWQFDDSAGPDLRRFKDDPRFKFVEYSCRESEGGSWARAIAQESWAGETYTLQIDSHMTFAPGWDDSLIRMMQTYPAEKPLITMIAPLFWLDEQGRLRKQTSAGIRSIKIRDWEESAGWSPWFVPAEPSLGGPARSRFLSGQFVFTLGSWTDEVRQDPQHYYWGEEFALTVRSYTHGYDPFLPDETVVYHMLHRNAPPKRHWEHGLDVVGRKNKVAYERLRRLVYADNTDEQKSLGRYGLGTARSLNEFERFAGMDLKNKRAHPDVFFGRSPQPVTIEREAAWAKCVTIKEFRAATTGFLMPD